MIKLNKTTHLMILFTFAVVFVVVYLYYTINDVKRLNTEVKKLSTDVAKLSQDLTNIVSTMSNFNKDVMDMKAGNVNNLLVKQQPQQTAPASAPQPVPAPAKQSIVDDIDSEDDDDSSVTTEELKKIIVENDDDTTSEKDDVTAEDEAPQSVLAPEPESQQQQSASTVNVDDLKKMKYDDLKELCKSKGVSTKGNKDQIITRLTGSS
jgi:outer membrane murein-binding lipoprotein Lpp